MNNTFNEIKHKHFFSVIHYDLMTNVFLNEKTEIFALFS